MTPTLIALALAGTAAPPDPGNVLRATKVGDDVRLDFAAAGPGAYRILRDVDKRDVGTSQVAGRLTNPTWDDPATVPPLAGRQLLYQVDGDLPCGACAGYSSPTATGAIAEPALIETSGLAASRLHPGVLWAHNDSGDSARFFAISTAGAALAEIVLEPGTTHVDWEDIAIGPCPTGTCVYLADVGDNGASRSQVALYRVAEPEVEVGQPVGTFPVPWERFPFTYQDGARDCEAVFVEPVSGDVYLVSKNAIGVPSRVYALRGPLVRDVPAIAEWVADLTVPTLLDGPMTAADLHPCQDRLLLRAYFRLWELERPVGAPFDDIFTLGTRTVVPLARETQGESVTYDASGEGYLTVSEGSAEELHGTMCR